MEVELRAVEKIHTAVATAPSTFNHLEVKTLNTACLEHFWTLEQNFSWQAQWILHFHKNGPNVRVFLRHFLKTMARMGRLSRICKDACMLGGQASDFLRGLASWSIRPSSSLRRFCVNRCSTSYGLASLFCGRRSTLDTWAAKSQHELARSRQLCKLSIFEGSFAELLRF